jgi:antitoxin FitA
MAWTLVLDLDSDLLERLRARAARHGRDIEEEAMIILRNAVAMERPEEEPLGTRIANLFRGIGLDGEIPELRGSPARPVRFDE